MATEKTPAKILAIVLAGGRGRHLQPMTKNNSKPSVVVGGYRLVDFVLSNLVNSGIDSIYLLAQYKPESLIAHVHTNWTFAPNEEGRFITIVLPPPHETSERFYGTVGAVYQNLDLIKRHAPDLVAIFAADQVYRMDICQMVDFHQAKNADITIVATRVPTYQATSSGVMVTGDDGRVQNFREKPKRPIPIPANPEYGYASMGNYLVNTKVLLEDMEQTMLRDGETNFGRHLLPHLIRSHRIYAYDFADNSVPGTTPHEQPGYWRDIETLEDYVDVLDDINGHEPRFRLHNPRWPISPALAMQRPLFDANYARLVTKQKILNPKALSSPINVPSRSMMHSKIYWR